MLTLWCEVCEVGWPASVSKTCVEPNCNQPGTDVDLSAKCRKSTGFATEGAKYARAHPEWTP